VINTYTMDKVDSPRLRRLLEKLALFQFKAKWRRGKLHVVPDVFSRFPVRPSGRRRLRHSTRLIPVSSKRSERRGVVCSGQA